MLMFEQVFWICQPSEYGFIMNMFKQEHKNKRFAIVFLSSSQEMSMDDQSSVTFLFLLELAFIF